MITDTTSETVSGKYIDLARPDPSQIDIHDIAWTLSRLTRFGGHSLSKTSYSVAQHTVMVSRYIEQALTKGTLLHEAFSRYVNQKAEELAVKSSDDAQLRKWFELQDAIIDMPADHVQMFAFHGLMHDFAEAYLTDLPTPVKKLPGIYEAYKAFEIKYDAMIYKRFGLKYGPKDVSFEGDSVQVLVLHESNIQHPATWQQALLIVGWADMYALQLESYHMMQSRGLDWACASLPTPSLTELQGFRQAIPPEQAYEELIERFNELKPAVYYY